MKKEEKRVWPMQFHQIEDELRKVVKEWNQDARRRAIFINDILRDLYEERLPYVRKIETTEQLSGCLFYNVSWVSPEEVQKAIEIYSGLDENFDTATTEEIEEGREEAIRAYQSYYNRKGSKI